MNSRVRKMKLETITQELASGVKLVRLEPPILDNSKVVFVAPVFTPHKNKERDLWDYEEDTIPEFDYNKKDFEGAPPEIISVINSIKSMGTFRKPVRRDEGTEEKIQPSDDNLQANSTINSLRSVGYRISSIHPDCFSQLLSKNLQRRLDGADFVLVPAKYLDAVNTRYGGSNKVVLTDEIRPDLAQFPQVLSSGLPISVHQIGEDEIKRELDDASVINRISSPIMDQTTYETLFGQSKPEQEERRRSSFYSHERRKSLIERKFSFLPQQALRNLEQVLRAPLTEVKPIHDRLKVIDYFVEKGSDYSHEFSSKLGAILSVATPLKKLRKSLSYMIECIRGDLGGALSREYKESGLNYDLPCKMDINHPLIKGIRHQQYHTFMSVLNSILDIQYENLTDISIPDIDSADMKRIKTGFDLFFSSDNPRGFVSMFKYLRKIRDANPDSPEALYKFMGKKDQIDKFSQGFAFIEEVGTWLSMYSGLAAYFKSHGWTRPTILDKEEEKIVIQDGWNPFLNTDEPKPNSTYLSAEKNVELVEGANQAGKSIYTLQVPIILAFAQAALYVPARSAEISIHDRIYVRVKRTGSIIDDQSAFRHEVDDTNVFIAQTDGHKRSALVCLDEWYTSTRPDNGGALLGALVEEELIPQGYKAVVTSHMPDLNDIPNRHPQVIFSYFPVDTSNGGVSYTYHKIDGKTATGTFDYGIRIAEHCGLPNHIVKAAYKRLQTKIRKT